MNNGKVVVAESIKPELMKMLQEATLKKGGELTFNEVKADLNMPDPNCYAPYFGTFQAAAKKAWSKAQRILATQRETETGKIAGTERKEEMAKRGTGAKKAGRPTKYSDDQIRAMMKEYFKSHGELPGFATFKKEHPDVTIRLDRFREIVHQTDPDVLGWVYEETSGDGELEASEESEGSGAILASEGLTAGDEAADSEAASDGVVSEPEEPIKVPEEVFEKPKTADPATSAEVADSEEKAVAEAPQGEVVVIDLGAESEGEKSEGSGAILAPEEPTEEDTVGLETADSASGEDSDNKGTFDDDGEPKEADSAEEPKGANDEAISEACAEAAEKLVEAPKMADSAMSAEEVVGPREDAVVEAPQGEVAAIDSGTEPECEESDGSGAILASEEPTEKTIVDPETADSASGEDSDSKGTSNDDGEPKDVDPAEKPKGADGKTIPALEGFYGYGGVASCCLFGDNYSISPNIMSCGGKRSMELKLCTIPAMDGGSIDLSVAISGDRDPSSTTPCDNGSDLRVVMKDAMTTFHIKGMGLSEYSLNRSVRNRRASLTVATIKRSLKIVFENCSVITVRDDVVDNMSGEFTLAIEAKVGAIYMCAGCEFEAISDSTEKSSKA